LPKEGWTSLTIGDKIYDSWHDFFEVRKTNLNKKGITSISGLTSGILAHVMKLDGNWLTDIIQTEEDEHGK